MTLRDLGPHRWRVEAGRAADIGQRRDAPFHALDALAADIGLAQKQISNNAHDRQREDNHDPGDAGRRIPVRAQQHPDDEAGLDQDMKGNQHGGQFRPIARPHPASPQQLRTTDDQPGRGAAKIRK
jgi:hypothetical protein